MLYAKVPVSKIAAEIGRHRSIVYFEIKRNYFTDEELPFLNGYYGMNAQKYASDRRARRHKLIRLEDLRSHVIAQLRIGWTPELIAGRLGYDDQPVRVNHEKITLTSTAPKDNQNNRPVICPADPRNGSRAMLDGPEARSFRRIGPSMNVLTT